MTREEALEAFAATVRKEEWQRVDWQGFCLFRRIVGCDGTDGHIAAFGTPKPRPHSESCPFHILEVLDEKS